MKRHGAKGWSMVKKPCERTNRGKSSNDMDGRQGEAQGQKRGKESEGWMQKDGQ